MSSEQAVAVVAGVGPGLSAALCRKLAAAGYAVAGLARHREVGERLAQEIGSAGGVMRLFTCDLTDEAELSQAFEAIERDLGVPDVLVYTAGAFLCQSLMDTQAADFEALWRVNCLGAFLCAQQAVSRMQKRGKGTLIFTGATSAVKPGAKFAAFGSSKFAQRGLAQSMARELGPQGIHVAHVIIDGVICAQDGDQDSTLKAEAVADSYLHLIQQDRSAWSFEFDLRPDVERF
ncbi:SDR family NAD(P)-dependent oxidoreductase [Pseudomonas sp. MPC6]|uniref:SDR family NAD(P)-dependent oxidoreductase n=1 Tax=unclassified Pseudomonas TaxID=196821 RepID=UPI0011101D22|nr:SDR family NAD(P)-dependent oxidoreductase [Pseudomonas sp. MPC6]QCY09507.1 SDR family NAD(P)-dependent oxidoreductase [Pseudomonas sp. MPC6]